MAVVEADEEVADEVWEPVEVALVAVEDFEVMLPGTLVEVAELLVLPLTEELADVAELESLYISNRFPAPQYS